MQNTTKALLREQLQKRRENIPEATRTTFSQIITERLIASVEWSEVRSVHCYAPILRKAEVDSWPFLQYLWRQWPDTLVAVPGPMVENRPTAYAINEATMWRETRTAPLPVEKQPLTSGMFDLIIVPCLGFDSAHYRLGNGGGYYDRLLLSQVNAKTYGLSFWAGYIPDGLPHEQHDIPLQRIISEEKVL
jgi:5-formyltetrahydrofolate cyclo-ligase